MLWTVRQLQSGTVLDSLCRTYKLSARHHALHPIVQLSYSQRESDLGNAVVQECRGLILETVPLVNRDGVKEERFGEEGLFGSESVVLWTGWRQRQQ